MLEILEDLFSDGGCLVVLVKHFYVGDVAEGIEEVHDDLVL